MERILITSGGTTEYLDAVRGITNFSTGKLGTVISEYFLNKNVAVDLITTKQAISPPPQEHLQIELIETVAELTEKMQQKLRVQQYLAVIQAMAVSDYTPIATKLTNDLKPDFSFTAEGINRTQKLASDQEYLIAVLQKTPKVIQMIKQLQPVTILVGFKLVVGCSLPKLLQIAQASLVTNQADLLVANDRTQVGTDFHQAFILNKKNNDVIETKTKLEIASCLYQLIEKIKNDEHSSWDNG